MDIMPAEKRSNIMRKIRSTNTKPELIVRRLLFSMGYRYRLHTKELPGKPDIVFPRQRKAIFVHGCFWHHHAGCVHGKMPKSRHDYWRLKLQKNIERDKNNQIKLKEAGWEILTVWECTLNDLDDLSDRLNKFLND